MKGKVVVITGSSTGLGKALARAFVQRGATVVVNSRDKETLEKVAAEVGATPFVADITKADDVAALADFAVTQFGRIDVWVNNAGVWMAHAPATELNIERVRVMFDVNVFGLMLGCKVALTQMRTQGFGTILNICSTSGLVGRPTSSAYSSSKWAVRGFSDSIRGECEGTNIQVVTAYPGGIKTNLFDEERPPEYADFMTPESVAEKIVANLELESPETEQIIKRPAQPDGPK